jgi:hypothetical protein
MTGGEQVQQLAMALVNSTRKPVQEQASVLVTMNTRLLFGPVLKLPGGMVKDVHWAKP